MDGDPGRPRDRLSLVEKSEELGKNREACQEDTIIKDHHAI